MKAVFANFFMKHFQSEDDKKSAFIGQGLSKVISNQDKSKVDRKILKALVNQEDDNYTEVSDILHKLKKQRTSSLRNSEIKQRDSYLKDNEEVNVGPSLSLG